MARGGSSSGGNGSIWPWLAWAVVIFLADQFTKVLILGYYKLGDATYITNFFNIVRAHNTGAAFSFLANAGDCAAQLFLTAVLRKGAVDLCHGRAEMRL